MRLLSLAVLLASSVSLAHAAEPNYDESKVGDITLPAITTSDSVDQWENERRAEVLKLFQSEMYGKPYKFDKVEVVSISDKRPLPDADAYIQEVILMLDNQRVSVVLQMPNADAPVPVFVGYNFCGNHSVITGDWIEVSKSWANPMVCGNQVDPTRMTTKDNKFLPTSRSIREFRWPAQEITARGYGLVTIYYGDVLPDDPAAFQEFMKVNLPEEDYKDYSAIGIWAAGLSAVADYLETRRDVDEDRMAVMGHSRLGKTALWTGATDERFKYIISNNAGMGGNSLSRRNYGETVDIITTQFPHWFTGSFRGYVGKENTLPIDQHMLMGLLAPRPVYVASAVDDQWADPKGEFLSLHNAKEVYALYTKDLFPESEQPAVDSPVHSVLSYHYRTGPHNVRFYDWQNYLDIADKYFK
ncbi:acetylxylan esterase [Rhodobacteraceae bacterium RKSG542]|uniref:alpha/beta hydrolase family protein n=1 Tax=Pseudovibrio flavus TaxID=2529854 RepID=UPI0012BD67E7|nr:acetylxylan esterase [Pseudovibrio flavus]MTI16214.1 acetylxylan esterase [Pseudovibrio flavus]